MYIYFIFVSIYLLNNSGNQFPLFLNSEAMTNSVSNRNESPASPTPDGGESPNLGDSTIDEGFYVPRIESNRRATLAKGMNEHASVVSFFFKKKIIVVYVNQ